MKSEALLPEGSLHAKHTIIRMSPAHRRLDEQPDSMLLAALLMTTVGWSVSQKEWEESRGYDQMALTSGKRGRWQGCGWSSGLQAGLC